MGVCMGLVCMGHVGHICCLLSRIDRWLYVRSAIMTAIIDVLIGIIGGIHHPAHTRTIVLPRYRRTRNIMVCKTSL